MVVIELTGMALLVATVTTCAVAVLRPLLARRLPDVATARSSHSGVVPRGGGAAVLLGFTAGMLVVINRSNTPDLLLAATLAAMCFAVLGLLEDVVGLSIAVRLVLQAMIAAVGAAGVSSAVVPELSTSQRWVTVILVAALGVFYVNAANFVDGVNGISGLHGLAVGGYFSALGAAVNSSDLTFAGVVVAAAFAAFLPWNMPRAAVFLGDVGSYLLGAAVWLLAVGAVAAGVSVYSALFPLTIYALDVVVTLLRRATRGVSVFEAHREHVYQQLQQATGSHSAAAVLCAAATGMCAIAGWQVQQGLPAGAGLAMVAATALVYVCSPMIVRAGRRALEGRA